MLKLKVIQDISTVAELYETCAHQLDTGDVDVDGSAVETIDTASLQALYAFGQSLQKREHKLIWQSKSKALISSAQQLGLLSALGLSDDEV